MGSKINRGFMFYLFILLAILVGAFLVCAVIMIFVPDFSLFGIKGFNENLQNVRIINMSVYDNKEDLEENASVSLKSASHPINKIEINSTIHSVKVFKNNELQGGTSFDQFVVIFNSKNFGFTTGEIQKSNITVKYYSDTQTLVIDAVGPEGFSFGGNASIILQVSPEYVTDNIDLTINSKRNITIGDSLGETSNPNPATINFKSVKLSTENDITITNYTNIGASARSDCSLKSKDGLITVDTIIKANDLDIEAGERTATFNEENQSFDLTGKLNITTNGTFVHLGEIKANNIYLKNKYGKIYFKNITGNVFIDKNSSKCDYDFENIIGKLTVGSYLDEDMVEGGEITVNGEILGEVNIAYTGNIKINRILSLTKIKNTKGSVNIEVVYAAVDIKTVDGNITLGTENIRVSNRVSVETTGKGKVLVYFASFDYAESIDSTINTKNGEVEIYLNENVDKDITATTTAKLTYFGEEIETKTGTWAKGVAKKLIINSKANIKINK
jgi:hypothetical protein